MDDKGAVTRVEFEQRMGEVMAAINRLGDRMERGQPNMTTSVAVLGLIFVILGFINTEFVESKVHPLRGDLSEVKDTIRDTRLVDRENSQTQLHERDRVFKAGDQVLQMQVNANRRDLDLIQDLERNRLMQGSFTPRDLVDQLRAENETLKQQLHETLTR